MRELAALFLWSAAFLKLFVYDVDRWLVREHFPGAEWLLDYKFAFVIALAAFLVVVWRRRMLWRWGGYIFFYPLVVLLWRFPAFVVKRRSWTLGLALVAIALSGIRSFRVNFVLAASLMLGTILCAFGRGAGFLILGATLVSVVVVGAYWRTVVAAFRPTLESFSTRTLSALWRFLQTTYEAEVSTGGVPEDLSDQECQKWLVSLQVVVLYNRACYFIAEKLWGLKRSNLGSVAYIVRLFALFCITVWSFFLLNFSLFRASPDNFAASGKVRGFDLFYYTFNTLFANTVPTLEPASILARSLFMGATLFMSLVFLVVVVFVVTSLLKERDEDQIDATVAAIRKHAEGIEPYIGRRYGMTLLEAIAALEELEAAFIAAIYYLSPELRPNEECEPS